MAVSTLQEALGGLQFSGSDNMWGLGATGLASALPALINPRGKFGTNLAVGLGGTLLTALLGYQARQQASQDTIETMGYGNQLLGMGNQDERLAFIKTIDDSQQAAKLSTLVTALGQNDVVTALNNRVKDQDSVRDVEKARLIAEANQRLQLGEQGTALYNREQRGLLALQTARGVALAAGKQAARGEQDPRAWIGKNISKSQQDALASAKGITTELLRLSSDMKALDQSAVAFQVASAIPGSKANLLYARMLALIPRTARLMGETGPLGEQEQARILKATLGSYASGTASIADRLREITTSAENMARGRAASLEAMHKPEWGASLLDTLGLGAGGEEEKRQRLIAQAKSMGLGN